MTAIRYLIVEDESISAHMLSSMIASLRPEYRLQRIIGSVEQAVYYLRENTVDLIFMDVELEDNSCFEIFSQLDVRTPIIFTTAYDAYALKAFHVDSIDYLLKPIEEASLAAAIDKFERLCLSRPGKAAPRTGSATPVVGRGPRERNEFRHRLMIVKGDTFQSVNIDDVACFASQEKYTFLYTFDKQRHIVDNSLNELEMQLDPVMFFRVTRNYIVNIGAIRNIHRYLNGRLKLRLRILDNGEIIISQARRDEFLRWFSGKID